MRLIDASVYCNDQHCGDVKLASYRDRRGYEEHVPEPGDMVRLVIRIGERGWATIEGKLKAV